MNIPVLSALVAFIEGIFKHTAPAVTTAVEQAAVGAAVESAEQDPKVAAVTAASVALLTAAKGLKTAIDESKATPAPDAPKA